VLAVNPVAGFGLLVWGMTNFMGDSYGHHGELRHFMPVEFGEGHRSSILWQPGCSTINDHGCAVALKQVDGLPDRVPFLLQLFQAGDHSMVGSYIPGCWASLRRWQESQRLNRSLVTFREFEWVNNALKKLQAQLNSVNNRIREHPSAYGRHQERIHKTNVLVTEVDKLRMTQERLTALHQQPVTAVHVYGSHAEHPEGLQASLRRWNGHPQNRVEEQLAMIPKAAQDPDAAIAAITGGHAVGAPFHLDIDSIA
jgi:hypothetical protein